MHHLLLQISDLGGYLPTLRDVVKQGPVATLLTVGVVVCFNNWKRTNKMLTDYMEKDRQELVKMIKDNQRIIEHNSKVVDDNNRIMHSLQHTLVSKHRSGL